METFCDNNLHSAAVLFDDSRKILQQVTVSTAIFSSSKKVNNFLITQQAKSL